MTETETENKDEKKLTLSRPKKLELKKTVETGQVRQSFSHGRSKTVTVEVRKKRTYERGASGRMTKVDGKLVEEAAPAPAPVAAESVPTPEAIPEEPSHANLTDQEKAVRVKALQEALKAEEENKRLEAERLEREKKEAEERKRRAEEEAKNPPPPAPEPKQAPPAKATKPAPAPASMPLPPSEKPDAKPAPKPAAKAAEEAKLKRAKEEQQRKTPTRGRGGDQRRRSGKLTIAAALDDNERTRSLASVRRAREKEKQKLRQATGADAKKIIREVTLPEIITVQELSNRMAERGADVIKSLMKMGEMATINQTIDADTAELVIEEFGHTVKRVSDSDVEIGLVGEDDSDENMQQRPPVVTVMGHVDHGKTSLLDALRATDVAGGEAGGITQHIGAYQVTLESGAKISFIDTPGHAAFTQMRARGARITDVVVLVVAADDGIMPQTVEAIHHAKAAEVPIIVAINKMDKPDADPTRVRNELLQHELVPEEMGGDLITVEVSAKARTNLDKLEEMILLQAEMLDLKANPDRACEGVVIEAKMERGRGSVATVLVQRGTLSIGDLFVSGKEWGRVRALVNDHGEQVKSVGPAMPVEVLGLNGTPSAGDDFVVVEDEQRAREISEFRERRERQARAAATKRGTLEQMFESIQAGEVKELPVVIKGDVQGSVEAIIGSLEKLGNEEVKVTVLHSAVGGVNESDITLAQASGAVVIGFNVRANPQARDMARRDSVDIRYYSIIYDVTDDLKKALTGIMAPTLRESFLGYAEIREVFRVTKVGAVAGCMITDGTVKRGAKVRLLRDDVVIHEGALSTLKRFKDDVKEVKEGFECGMSFENYDDLKKGDMIECFEIEEVAGEL
ncbi:translation initiation factor IF-2 [Magnetospira sp. QH-2]|uniref:translation initiation factor IF-2 n=1 Tax=Magnetospira sp. (strain QH-2) TaxID=1288970 RepID=UPI0003E80BE6|nr:translation initiation factor IF-2 [Magnetospira sp. QH-2]CCQ75719.1 Translation initiation factor IF-2 [Magnetospira sp. QH-2]